MKSKLEFWAAEYMFCDGKDLDFFLVQQCLTFIWQACYTFFADRDISIEDNSSWHWDEYIGAIRGHGCDLF